MFRADGKLCCYIREGRSYALSLYHTLRSTSQIPSFGKIAELTRARIF